MLWSPISDSCDVCRCTSLFRNANIKGTPESAVKRSQGGSGSSAAKRARRLVVGMASSASQCKCSAARTLASPGKGELAACGVSHENGCSAIFSPVAQNLTPQKPAGFKLTKPRLPLEEFDPNSQDSGYGGSCTGFGDEKPQQQQSQQQQQQHDAAAGQSGFQFAEPLGVAPRRLSLDSRSPVHSPLRASPQQSRKRPALFRSASSGYESTDDGFNDLIDMESLESACGSLPNGLSSLISGDIVADTSSGAASAASELMAIATTPEAAPSRPPGFRGHRLAVRRSLSLQIDGEIKDGSGSSTDDEEGSPVAPRARSCLFRSPNASSSAARLGFGPGSRPEPGVASPPPLGAVLPPPPLGRKFKRPEPPGQRSPLAKRSRKSASFCSGAGDGRSGLGALQRSLSEPEAHAHIKRAVGRSATEADLTGDFSKPCALPLAEGQHEDLKSISVQTLARLMRGEFADSVADFRIVDCRYPYEFEGGHIRGALNLYTKEMVEQLLSGPLEHAAPAIEPDQRAPRRRILVFHCEFSWERGPNLSRFLRSVDRQRNKEHYPALHYPELYLLHGGYQLFYKEQRDLCSPQGYLPMRHSDYEADLRQCRSKSKSWQGERSGANRLNVLTARANLKRLAF